MPRISQMRECLSTYPADSYAPHGIGTATRSSGLTNMRRMAEHHGGSFTVTASDEGGTELVWTLRIDS